jgi:hypothetical protein
MNSQKSWSQNGVYDILELIDGNVMAGTEFYGFDINECINRSIKFQNETLLHQYIVTTATNYYSYEFKKNYDLYEDNEFLDIWYERFEEFNVSIPRYKSRENYNPKKWFDRHRSKFEELFGNMSDEIFYILFNNRRFLLQFNDIVSNTVNSVHDLIPKEHLTVKGTIKRVNIPIWVKNAVFHRDKGRCVFCHTDLTNMVNTLTAKNYDHIVPLDLLGVNDPCNIQLACERCNKSKSNSEPSTNSNYYAWW